MNWIYTKDQEPPVGKEILARIDGYNCIGDVHTFPYETKYYFFHETATGISYRNIVDIEKWCLIEE